jgi:hypothetical protein
MFWMIPWIILCGMLTHSFENQRAVLEAEKILALDDLELRHADNLDRLQEEWSSEQMQAKFRRHAKSLMTAGRFDEAAVITSEITDREAKEIEEATKRMGQAYQRARERMKQQFDGEKKAAAESYDIKLLGLTKEEESMVRPMQHRIEKMEKLKAELEATAKRSRPKPVDPSLIPKRVIIPVDQEPLVVNRKLKLPPLAFMAGNSTV